MVADPEDQARQASSDTLFTRVSARPGSPSSFSGRSARSPAPRSSVSSLPRAGRLSSDPALYLAAGQFAQDPRSYSAADRREDVYVPVSDVAQLQAQLRSARARLDAARRTSGDRVASAMLEIENDLDVLRRTYPARVQLSLYYDPEIEPFAPPFWAMGLWHDGEYTYLRLLGDRPRFFDESSGAEIVPYSLDDYLYRLEGVVGHGSVIVGSPDAGGDRQLYWYRRPETEGP